MEKSILIIGAGGFIGGFIAKAALERGYRTWVAVRQSTSRRYLSDERLNFVTLDYDDPDAMATALKGAAPEGGKWDFMIWNLGATKCANFADFNRINYQYVRDFVLMLEREQMVPGRFLFMSSLSALGEADEKTYSPMTSATIPNPNTRYGLSKIKAETFLETRPDFPWIIFRPTGVYGPHEQDYLMMIKSIDAHWDFGVGYRKQMLTFIYVEDLVNAMFDALAAGVVRRKYIISEERAYTQSEFRSIVAKALGRKFVIPVRLPLWTAYIASVVAEKWGVARMKPSTLNRDKFKIMRQRNWNCDVSDAARDFGFRTRFSLERGVAETVKAYLAEKEQRKKRKEVMSDNQQTGRQKVPAWVTAVIIVCMLPVAAFPTLLSMSAPDSAARLFVWFYPAYVIAAGICARICWRQRRDVMWILLVTMLMSHAAMWALVLNENGSL